MTNAISPPDLRQVQARYPQWRIRAHHGVIYATGINQAVRAPNLPGVTLHASTPGGIASAIDAEEARAGAVAARTARLESLGKTAAA